MWPTPWKKGIICKGTEGMYLMPPYFSGSEAPTPGVENRLFWLPRVTQRLLRHYILLFKFCQTLCNIFTPLLNSLFSYTIWVSRGGHHYIKSITAFKGHKSGFTASARGMLNATTSRFLYEMHLNSQHPQGDSIQNVLYVKNVGVL
jgi:hypothetical protein